MHNNAAALVVLSGTVTLMVLAGALGVALYAIGSTVARSFSDMRDALAGRPRLFGSTEPDRWRSVHRRADRRRAFAPADPAPSRSNRSKRG